MTGDKLYLSYILECIDRIEQFTEGGREQFVKSLMVQDAVLRNLHTLSESSTRITPEIVRYFPEVPWKEIRAFRHVVVHDYLGLDLDQIWQIVTVDLPPLKDAIREMLKRIP